VEFDVHSIVFLIACVEYPLDAEDVQKVQIDGNYGISSVVVVHPLCSHHVPLAATRETAGSQVWPCQLPFP